MVSRHYLRFRRNPAAWGPDTDSGLGKRRLTSRCIIGSAEPILDTSCGACCQNRHVSDLWWFANHHPDLLFRLSLLRNREPVTALGKRQKHCHHSVRNLLLKALLKKHRMEPQCFHIQLIMRSAHLGHISRDKMNNDIIENSFAKDEIRKDYKLGKILATSAIVSDFPLGPIKPKRTKLKLFSLALILGCLGFAVYSNHAEASSGIKFVGHHGSSLWRTFALGA